MSADPDWRHIATVMAKGAQPRECHERLVAGLGPFGFALTRVGRFPGVLYLAPEPAGPFVRLTTECNARWPDFAPYGGAHDQVVPHLTVAEGPEPAGLAEELERRLPIQTEATDCRGGSDRCADGKA
jgi:hypothetical protein